MASVEDPNIELPVIFMLSKFDFDAAQNATPDEARLMLKMIKHYVRALHGDERINWMVKDLLLKFGIDPSLPYSVAGGFPCIMEILRDLHECSGRKCVLKLKAKQAKRIETLKKKKEAKAKKADYQMGVKAGKKKDPKGTKVATKEVQKGAKAGRTKAAVKEVQKGAKAGRTKAAAKTETARKKAGKGPERKKAPKAEVAGPSSKVAKASSSESDGSCSKEFPLHYI